MYILAGTTRSNLKATCEWPLSHADSCGWHDAVLCLSMVGTKVFFDGAV